LEEVELAVTRSAAVEVVAVLSTWLPHISAQDRKQLSLERVKQLQQERVQRVAEILQLSAASQR
jgi:hypothetical protein